MKRVFLALALLAGCAHGQECSQLSFSANPNYPPFHWSDHGRLVGASIELTERIFKDLGVKASARYVGPWARVLRAAETGDIDLVVALKATPDREAFLAFTPQRFYANPIAVFVRADRKFAYAGWRDLAGRTALVARGDRFGDGFDEFLRDQVKVFPANNMESGFGSLELGRADFMVTGYYAGKAFLAGKGLDATIVALAPPINQGSVQHGFVRNSPCHRWLDKVSERLRAYEADGTTERLLNKYLELWRTQAASRVE